MVRRGLQQSASSFSCPPKKKDEMLRHSVALLMLKWNGDLMFMFNEQCPRRSASGRGGFLNDGDSGKHLFQLNQQAFQSQQFCGVFLDGDFGLDG